MSGRILKDDERIRTERVQELTKRRKKRNERVGEDKKDIKGGYGDTDILKKRNPCCILGSMSYFVLLHV